MMILKSFDVFSYEYCRYTTFMYNTYYNSRPISLSYISCARYGTDRQALYHQPL